MRKQRVFLGLLVLGLLLGGLGLIVLTGRDGSFDQVTDGITTVAEDLGIQEEQAASEPDAAPAATPAGPRLVIPRLGVDAPTITLGVDATGTMLAPAAPMDVAWYSFSAQPGQSGNAVMAGHVDYLNYGPAVFWRLREARAGDEVQVVLNDGTIFNYTVSSVTSYDADTAPVAEIVGPTPGETLTLITCTGTFDRTTRQYENRLVVRATRLTAAAPR
jgi:LPXTG-site transpeptidase (sortase) family protein